MEVTDLRALIEQEIRRQLGLAEAEPSTGRQVLAVFGTTPEGREVGLEQVATLRGKGYAVRVWEPAVPLGSGAIGNGRGAPDRDGQDPTQLLEECDAVVVPALGWVEAAKLAQGLADTPALLTVFTAMCLGLPVLIARDGCSPTLLSEGGSPQRRARAQAIAKLFAGYLQRLESFGARLVPAADLAAEVESALAPSVVATVSASFKGPKQIVTGEDVLSALGSSQRIVVPEGSIVTALAAELAKSKGVTIELTQ